MATNENIINVPGRLHSVAIEGHVAGADEIYDDILQKDQATINQEVNEAIGTGGSVDSRISTAINALDASVSKSAGADGLALSVTEENGKVTAINGSIASNTYDAYGAASTAKSELLGDAASEYNTLGKLEDKIQAEASRAEGTESVLDGRVDALEVAVGTGGSVDSRISTAVNTAKSEIKGNATSACDTLGEAEALISDEKTRAQSAESTLQNNISAEVSRAQATEGALQQLYENLTQSDIVVVEDHMRVASPSTNTIYREMGETSYIDWMYYGSAWKKMAEYDNAIDDDPTAGSENLVKSGGVVQNIILSHRNFEVLKNHTENWPSGDSHNIEPRAGKDLLVVYVGNLSGRIKVLGPTEHEGNGVRYSFWSTARIKDCTNENFISWTRFSKNATVKIPSGAKMMALHLVSEDYSEGYDGIQVEAYPYQQTGEKRILSVKSELAHEVTENRAIDVNGVVSETTSYNIYSYTVDDSKDYCVSLCSQGSGSFITAVGYYDAHGQFLGAEYIRKGGEDSILNRNFLTLPQGTAIVKVNVYKSLTIVKVEEIVVTTTKSDEYTKRIYDFDGVSVLLEDDIEYINNKYLTTSGEISDSSNSKVSLPIHLNIGDSVIVNTNSSNICVIAEYKNNEYIPLLNASTSIRRFYTYVCTKSEMDICICGRKDMKITVCRFKYSSQLLRKIDIDATVMESKFINYDGSIEDSTSGKWDVYVYDINPRNLYSFTGGMGVNNTGNVIFYYDENDAFISSFLCGNSEKAMRWDDIFIYIPLNAVKARVNVLKSIGCTLKMALRNEPYIEPSAYDGLPSYYDSYMKSRAADVNKAFIYANPNTTSFCFSSDLHYPINQNLGRLVAKVLDTTKVTAFVCGGDIPNNSLNYGEEVTPEEALMMTFNEYENDLSIIRSTGKSVYTLRGNHDYAINKDYGEGSEGAVYVDYKATRNMLMNDNFLIPGIVFNESDDVGCYFYKDFPVAKTRYIFLDTTDSNGNDGQNSKSPHVSDTQMVWIVTQAVLTCPSDYNLVILSHIYIQRNCGTADSYSSYHNFDNLRTLFAAVQNKTSCTILGQSYNFSSFAPNILLHIAGHNHRDTAVFMDGFWSFTTAANYINNELPKSPLYQKFPIDTKYVYNGKGTIYENLTDAVLVNGEVSVEVFRYGAGYDREFRQTPYTVSAGSTLQIESSMEAEDIKWWCHDSIGRSPSSGGIIIYNNDFATIDEETGLLTAIAAGYVTVVAFSESLNKVEYIGVKVS